MQMSNSFRSIPFLSLIPQKNVTSKNHSTKNLQLCAVCLFFLSSFAINLIKSSFVQKMSNASKDKSGQK